MLAVATPRRSACSTKLLDHDDAVTTNPPASFQPTAANAVSSACVVAAVVPEAIVPALEPGLFDAVLSSGDAALPENSITNSATLVLADGETCTVVDSEAPAIFHQ